MITAGGDRAGSQALIWDVATRKLTVTVSDPHGGAIRYAVPLPSHDYFLCGGKALYVVELATGKIVAEIGAPVEQVIDCLGVTPDGRFAAATREGDDSLRLWRLPPEAWAMSPAACAA